MTIKAISIKVYGVVQGVFFRATTEKQAQSLGIKGYVKNETDGSVRIYAEGPSNKIAEFIRWCEKGPQNARVKEILIEEEPPRHLSEFKIIR